MKRGGQPKPLTPNDPRHGTWNAYNNYGCRCEDCCGQGPRVMRERRARQSGRVIPVEHEDVMDQLLEAMYV